MCTTAIYLEGYIGDDIYKGDWIKKHAANWKRDLCAIRKTADKYPQDIYAVVDRAVQSEWIFLQRVTKEKENVFTGLENFLQETFLPRIFLGPPPQ